MAIIPSFFMDAVIALGIDTGTNNKHWIGSGFLVGRKETEDPNRFTIYIITNKHVVENKNLLYVRFNNSGNIGVKDLQIMLKNLNICNYSVHPNPYVDIAVIQILPQIILDNHLSLSFFDEDSHMLTLEQMRTTGVDEGGLVYALGFPMNLVNDAVKAPICRLGCISRVTDAFLAGQGAVNFLVDAQTFPGNSGGPIISRPEHISIAETPFNTAANLIGILSAYIPYRDTLVSQQTGQPVMIREENSGLTIVHPVDRIKEVIEIEWQRNEQIRLAQQIQPPLAVATGSEVRH